MCCSKRRKRRFNKTKNSKKYYFRVANKNCAMPLADLSKQWNKDNTMPVVNCWTSKK